MRLQKVLTGWKHATVFCVSGTQVVHKDARSISAHTFAPLVATLSIKTILGQSAIPSTLSRSFILISSSVPPPKNVLGVHPSDGDARCSARCVSVGSSRARNVFHSASAMA